MMWVFFADGKVEKMKERVEIDEENKSMTVFVFDGDVMDIVLTPKLSTHETVIRSCSSY